jgi:hypothetical protein
MQLVKEASFTNCIYYKILFLKLETKGYIR